MMDSNDETWFKLVVEAASSAVKKRNLTQTVFSKQMDNICHWSVLHVM